VKESHKQKQKQKGESIFPKIKKRELVREKITHTKTLFYLPTHIPIQYKNPNPFF
jgi:hypothetical protein